YTRWVRHPCRGWLSRISACASVAGCQGSAWTDCDANSKARNRAMLAFIDDILAPGDGQVFLAGETHQVIVEHEADTRRLGIVGLAIEAQRLRLGTHQAAAEGKLRIGAALVELHGDLVAKVLAQLGHVQRSRGRGRGALKSNHAEGSSGRGG